MRYNPTVRKRLEAIKDDQHRKNCMTVMYALSVGASAELLFNTKDETATLKESGLIKIENDKVVVAAPMFIQVPKKNEMLYTETGIDKIVEERIDEYRELFKGTKVGAMGDRNACITKMKRWMSVHPDITFDQILEASTHYLASMNDNRYVTQADYFIFKQDVHKEEISKLSSIVEEIDFKHTGSNPWDQTL